VNVTAPTTMSVTRWVNAHHVVGWRQGEKTRPSTASR